MSDAGKVKQGVRDFYDTFGWKPLAEGLYHDARYEDLRPVSREYVQRCRQRVTLHLPSAGEYLLDGGSGPIQYPEYLEYSRDFRYRVCLDISRLALQEARSRMGEKGLFVVGDISTLPFKADAFEGVVSMHVVYHLPPDDQARTFWEFFRVLKPSGKGVIVYSWGEHAALMRLARLPMKIASGFVRLYSRNRFGKQAIEGGDGNGKKAEKVIVPEAPSLFSHKFDYRWLCNKVGDLPGFDIRVWRTASSAFLRAFIFRPFFGEFWLRVLYRMEEMAPHLMGRLGQYPMILFEKPTSRPTPGSTDHQSQ